MIIELLAECRNSSSIVIDNECKFREREKKKEEFQLPMQLQAFAGGEQKHLSIKGSLAPTNSFYLNEILDKWLVAVFRAMDPSFVTQRLSLVTK